MSKDRKGVVREIDQTVQRLGWLDRHDLAARLSSRGLTALQFAALRVLESQGREMAIGAIGEAMLAPASSMTSVVDRLVDLDLVERAPHPHDRRAIMVRITDEGRELVCAVEEQRLETLLRLLNGVSDEDLGYFLARLQVVATEAVKQR